MEQKSPEKVRKKLEKEFEKERESFRKQIKHLDDDHSRDKTKLKQLHDRCEKSKLEVIGLNKGITRKIDENAQLREEVNLLMNRTEELQTTASNAKAELHHLRQVKAEFDAIQVKEKRLQAICKLLVDNELESRRNSRGILRQLSETLEMENVLESSDVTPSLKSEIERLT